MASRDAASPTETHEQRDANRGSDDEPDVRSTGINRCTTRHRRASGRVRVLPREGDARRRIEALPSDTREPDLDPRVGVLSLER